jgi:hypothetical protein
MLALHACVAAAPAGALPAMHAQQRPSAAAGARMLLWPPEACGQQGGGVEGRSACFASGHTGANGGVAGGHACARASCDRVRMHAGVVGGVVRGARCGGAAEAHRSAKSRPARASGDAPEPNAEGAADGEARSASCGGRESAPAAQQPRPSQCQSLPPRRRGRVCQCVRRLAQRPVASDRPGRQLHLHGP